MFVKPTQGGSSFGVTRVEDPSKLHEAVKFAFTEGPTVRDDEQIPVMESDETENARSLKTG